MAKITAAQAQRRVDAIDKRIDAVRAELFRNETVDEMDAASWQRAWDRHPALLGFELSLFSRRYDAAQLRDEAAGREARIEDRRAARKMAAEWNAKNRCPNCGSLQLAA